MFQNKHIRKHLVLSKTYKCMESGCQYASVNMANLDNHLRKAHKQGKECTYCDFESRKFSTLIPANEIRNEKILFVNGDLG